MCTPLVSLLFRSERILIPHNVQLAHSAIFLIAADIYTMSVRVATDQHDIQTSAFFQLQFQIGAADTDYTVFDSAATANIPFLVREIDVQSCVTFWTQGTAGNSPFLIYSDLTGVWRPLIHGEHDRDLESGVVERTHPENLMHINGTYRFGMRGLGGGPYYPTLPTGEAITVQCNILVKFKSF